MDQKKQCFIRMIRKHNNYLLYFLPACFKFLPRSPGIPLPILSSRISLIAAIILIFIISVRDIVVIIIGFQEWVNLIEEVNNLDVILVNYLEYLCKWGFFFTRDSRSPSICIPIIFLKAQGYRRPTFGSGTHVFRLCWFGIHHSKMIVEIQIIYF